MKKELEAFENRSDDWLADQIKHEQRVSAWDFDDAKKLKQEHERKHLAYKQMNSSLARTEKKENNGGAFVILLVFIATMTLGIVAFLAQRGDIESLFYVPFIVICGSFVISIISAASTKGGKK